MDIAECTDCGRSLSGARARQCQGCRHWFCVRCLPDREACSACQLEQDEELQKLYRMREEGRL